MENPMRPTRRALIAGAVALGTAGAAAAAPRARLIEGPWQRFGTAPDPDHSAWGGWLDRWRVTGKDGIARCRYGAAVAAGDRPSGYLAMLQAVDPTGLDRAAAMAFWINLYNALTVDLVLEAWPVGSIRQVRGGLFNSGPWGERLVTVAGHRLSLDDIEHGILRPVWQDNRVHYAVNCASIGCPNLAAAPWTGGRLEPMLDEAARAHVNHPRGAEVTAEGLVVSSIYDWFAADFGGSDEGVIDHLRTHAAPALARRLEGVTRIADDRYDWSINTA